MPTAKVTKNVSAAIGGGNVLCSTLISIKTKAWLYSFRCTHVVYLFVDRVISLFTHFFCMGGESIGESSIMVFGRLGDYYSVTLLL